MTSTTQEERLLEALTGEMLLFGMLGKLIYTYPAQDWIAELLPQELFAEAPFAAGNPKTAQGLALLQDWNESAAERLVAEVVRELEEDFQVLFLGMGEIVAPPWESVYLTHERLVFQEQTLQVRMWYRRFGLEIEKFGSEPDDHIGLELVFLAHLASLAIEARGKDDPADYSEIMVAQREFLDAHLLKWAPKWSGDVAANSRTGFYHGIALLVDGALAEARTLVGEEAPEGLN